MTNCIFSGIDELDHAKSVFDTLGYCGFSNLLGENDLQRLLTGVDEAINSGDLKIGESSLLANNDAIFAHEEIERICKEPQLVQVARALLGGCEIELQHSKFNAKPKKDTGEGKIPWHQDYPYFPHSNFDLIACVIHLDDEQNGSGSLEFVPGSHRLGIRSHLRKDGTFAYECTDQEAIDSAKPELVIARRGWVTFHHGSTLHRSAPKTISADRRFVVFQYRAIDAVQLAGVIWKCNGYQVHAINKHPRVARFPCGTKVELRGISGRLYDPFSSFSPDKPADY